MIAPAQGLCEAMSAFAQTPDAKSAPRKFDI
jgi:hypothetical protein